MPQSKDWDLPFLPHLSLDYFLLLLETTFCEVTKTLYELRGAVARVPDYESPGLDSNLDMSSRRAALPAAAVHCSYRDGQYTNILANLIKFKCGNSGVTLALYP